MLPDTGISSLVKVCILNTSLFADQYPFQITSSLKTLKSSEVLRLVPVQLKVVPLKLSHAFDD